ncbi:MAG: transcription antitermination factor NusB, partial [Kofleriaceae bacterium]|nr:transcription antitermination factor NusB [Kofleriaceae bacterium]
MSSGAQGGGRRGGGGGSRGGGGPRGGGPRGGGGADSGGGVSPRASIGAREVARRVLDRIQKDKAWATPALDGELARAGLADRDRRLASELVYGVLRHRARIDRALVAHADLKKTPPKVVTALRVAAYQLLFLDRIPGYAAIDDAVAAARGAGGPKLGGFANAVLRKLSTNGEPPITEEGAAKLLVEHSLPAWIFDELEAAATDGVTALTTGPTDVAGLAAAFAQAAPIIARANVRRTDREKLAAELEQAGVTASPIAAAPGALKLEGLGDPSRNESFVAGRWTVQDTGAQLVALSAQPLVGMKILDACAGVGGKATHLAELTDDQATIDAADLSKTKLGLLAETAARLGLASIRRHVCDLLDPAAPLAGDYDLIVLDAPCSGLGVLRRHPDAKWRLTAGDVPRLADLQR